VVAAAALAVGRPLRRALAPETAAGPAWRWALDGLAGLVALHFALLGLDLAGVPWRRRHLLVAVVALAATAAVAARWARRRRAAAGCDGARPPGPAGDAEAAATAGARPGWGDAVALVALSAFAVLAWRLRVATPDFVYHWGLKGHRYALARGIDWAFLADPLRLTDHPDYPNLLPDLYASTALVAGRFDERSMMLGSVVFFALMLLAARQAWARWGVGGTLRQAATAALALAVGMFAVGYQLAGGADWLPALALLVALPALLAPGGTAADRGDDLTVGLAAALAAGAKMEGLPLAGFLVAVHLGRRALAARGCWGGGGRGGRGAGAADPAGPLGGWWDLSGAALRAAAPALLVVAPWLAGNLRHGLFQPTNAGAFDPANVGAVLPALAEALATREWHGLGWLVLAAPLLAAARRTRPLGLVVTLQLLFYLYVYLTAPIDPRAYVLASFPRLLFHLVPAVVAGVVLLAAPAGVGGARPDAAAIR
jgi:hypothetical protein